jgi:hypothetical protein
MSLNKQDIFSRKPQLTELAVPEWGGSVWVRPITVEEQGKLGDLTRKYGDASRTVQFRECTIPLILWTVLDPDGIPLFTKDDVPALMNSPAAPILRIQDFVLKFSGLTEESRKELEKNSPPTTDFARNS